MSNYGVNCDVWLSLFSGKEKKEKEGALEQVRWGPCDEMKLCKSRQYDETY